MEKFQLKILEELAEIKLNQAVTHERLKTDIQDGVDRQEDIKELQIRQNKHEKIFGGVVMFVVILTTILGLVMNSQRIISATNEPKTVKHMALPTKRN